MELSEGNAGQAVGRYKISHETAEGGGRGGRKREHLGKVPGLRNNEDLKYLNSLQEGWPAQVCSVLRRLSRILSQVHLTEAEKVGQISNPRTFTQVAASTR